MEAAEKEEISVEDEAVDKNIFKDCSKIAFYRRQKHQLSRRSTYQALLDSVTTGKDSTKFHIINETTKVPLLAEVYGIEGNIFRLKINEETPLKPRYEVPDVLTIKPSTVRLISCSGDAGSLVLADGKGDLKCHITANPFKIDLVSEEEIVMSINSLDQLYFEHLQIPLKQRSTKENKEDTSVDASQEDQEDLGLWEEKFGKFVDVKVNVPECHILQKGHTNDLLIKVLPPLVWISPCMDLNISTGSHNMQNHTNLKILVMAMLTVFITWMSMDIKYMTKWAFMVQCLIFWPTS